MVKAHLKIVGLHLQLVGNPNFIRCHSATVVVIDFLIENTGTGTRLELLDQCHDLFVVAFGFLLGLLSDPTAPLHEFQSFLGAWTEQGLYSSELLLDLLIFLLQLASFHLNLIIRTHWSKVALSF